MSTMPASPANDSGPAPGRLMSIDALRGCDMFWIVGGEEIIHALHKISHTGFVSALAGQMDHKPWEGVAFYDLIFPLFVFIVGVSLVFSLSKTMEQAGRRTAYRRILVRGLLLYLIGLVYYKGIANGFDHVRLLGVLQRIAICYLCAGLVFCTFQLRGMIVTFLALLIGYWALMTFVPKRKNWPNWRSRPARQTPSFSSTVPPIGLAAILRKGSTSPTISTSNISPAGNGTAPTTRKGC
jgi:predicted acyltransferase